MEWKSFAANKNVDDPQVHEEFLHGGVHVNQQHWRKSLELSSHSIVAYYNLFLQRTGLLQNDIGRELFLNVVSRKFAKDLVSFNLLPSDESFEFRRNGINFELNNTLKPDEWSDDEDGEETSKNFIGAHMEFNDQNQIYFFLSARGVTRTNMKKYDNLWNYAVMAVTKIISTMELRLENLISATQYKSISRGVQNTTFLDIFADTKRENAPLFQVYMENKKYLKYIEEKESLPLAVVPVLTEWTQFGNRTFQESKTFDLERVVVLLEKALLSINIGFYVEDNYQ